MIFKKYQRLLKFIQNYRKPLLALSGGLDSSFLAYSIKESGVNGESITLKSPFFPDSEILRAINIAKNTGLNNFLIDIGKKHLQLIETNPTDRCYVCKKENFTTISKYARENNFDVVFDGTTFDDSFSYRPGLKAIEELGIKSPIKEAQISKNEIRQLCRSFNLSFAELPSFSCFATRFPYYEKLTSKKIEQVKKAELFFHQQGFKKIRVRSHNNLARIEIDLPDMKKFNDPKLQKVIIKKLKNLGFDYITLDLEGFRSGSMDVGVR